MGRKRRKNFLPQREGEKNPPPFKERGRIKEGDLRYLIFII